MHIHMLPTIVAHHDSFLLNSQSRVQGSHTCFGTPSRAHLGLHLTDPIPHHHDDLKSPLATPSLKPHRPFDL